MRRPNAGGRAGAGGFDFQARAAAFVLAHSLAAESLEWTEHEQGDAPLAVSSETGGPGDDLRVELPGGRIYEVQVRRSISAGAELDRLAVLFGEGLRGDPSMTAVLAVGLTASEQVREHLREDLRRLAQGRRDNLKPVTQRFIGSIGGEQLARRTRVVVLQLESDDGAARRIAMLLLGKVVPTAAAERSGWDTLCEVGHRLAAEAGRRDQAALVTLLGARGIEITQTPRYERANVYKTSRAGRITTAIAASKGTVSDLDFINIPRVVELALSILKHVPRTAFTEQLQRRGLIDRSGMPTRRLVGQRARRYPMEGLATVGVKHHFSDVFQQLIERVAFEDLEWLIRERGRFLSSGVVGKRCFYVGTLLGRSPVLPITSATPPTPLGFRKKGVIGEWLVDPSFVLSTTAIDRLGRRSPYIAYGTVRGISTRRIEGRRYRVIDLRPLLLGIPTRMQQPRPHSAALRRSAVEAERELREAKREEAEQEAAMEEWQQESAAAEAAEAAAMASEE